MPLQQVTRILTPNLRPFKNWKVSIDFRWRFLTWNSLWYNYHRKILIWRTRLLPSILEFISVFGHSIGYNKIRFYYQWVTHSKRPLSLGSFSSLIKFVRIKRCHTFHFVLSWYPYSEGKIAWLHRLIVSFLKNASCDDENKMDSRTIGFTQSSAFCVSYDDDRNGGCLQWPPLPLLLSNYVK